MSMLLLAEKAQLSGKIEERLLAMTRVNKHEVLLTAQQVILISALFLILLCASIIKCVYVEEYAGPLKGAVRVIPPSLEC